MQKSGINHWLAASLAGLFISSAAGQGAKPVTLELQLDERRPLNKECYAANLQLQYGPLWFNHPDFIGIYQEAGTPFLRFPGGTTANFYNPESGLMTENTPYTKHDMTRLNDSIRKFRSGGGNTDEGFFEFVNQTGSRYSVVLNVSTRTLEQNRAWLESVKARGVEMTHFEIGNELYYTFFDWADAAKSAMAYIKRAKESAVMIRSIFPAAKVGVIVPSHIYMFESYSGRRDKLPKRMQEWYDAMEKESFFDSVVIHLYSDIGMVDGTKVENFITVAEGYENVIGYAERNLDSALDILEEKFPGKEIWVTEYGVNGFSGSLGKYDLRPSHLGCLHSDLMLMRYLSRSSVHIAHWHAFNQFYEYRYGDNPGIRGERTQQYEHFSLFADPVLNSELYVPVKFDQGAQLEVGAFIGKDKGYIIVLNKRGQTHSLGSLESTKSIRLTGALQLTLSADLPQAEAMESAEKMERIELRGDALQSVMFAPYSITRLEFEWEQDGQFVLSSANK